MPIGSPGKVLAARSQPVVSVQLFTGPVSKSRQSRQETEGCCACNCQADTRPRVIGSDSHPRVIGSDSQATSAKRPSWKVPTLLPPTRANWERHRATFPEQTTGPRSVRLSRPLSLPARHDSATLATRDGQLCLALNHLYSPSRSPTARRAFSLSLHPSPLPRKCNDAGRRSCESIPPSMSRPTATPSGQIQIGPKPLRFKHPPKARQGKQSQPNAPRLIIQRRNQHQTGSDQCAQQRYSPLPPSPPP
jgi:hypothetical protein